MPALSLGVGASLISIGRSLQPRGRYIYAGERQPSVSHRNQGSESPKPRGRYKLTQSTRYALKFLGHKNAQRPQKEILAIVRRSRWQSN